MKVLQVIDSGGLYGAERILLALMDSLQTEGIDCTLASIAEPGLAEKPLEARARHLGLEVRRITMTSGPDRDATRELVDQACRERFHLIHTHGYKANTLLAGWPGSKGHLPVVATLHGWTATSLWSRVGLYELVERLALRGADRIVAVSEVMVQKWRLNARYGDKLRVIRNGIPTPAAKAAKDPLPDRIAAFIAGRLTIFAAGRLSYEKGFDVLLEALAAIRKRGVDACLVLVGEGRQRETLDAQAQSLGIAKAVLMPGYIENAQALMRNVKVIAIPSRTEGLPVVLLEALMSGTPVVASAVGEMPAVMQSCDAGSCPPSGDSASLVTLLIGHLCQNGQRWSGFEIAERARMLYSSEVMASAYSKLYRELTGSA